MGLLDGPLKKSTGDFSKRIKRIHINQHAIKKNQKHGTQDPVITCKTGKENLKGRRLIIYDEEGNDLAVVVYRPEKPLSCGARVWIETKMPVSVEDWEDLDDKQD